MTNRSTEPSECWASASWNDIQSKTMQISSEFSKDTAVLPHRFAVLETVPRPRKNNFGAWRATTLARWRGRLFNHHPEYNSLRQNFCQAAELSPSGNEMGSSLSIMCLWTSEARRDCVILLEVLDVRACLAALGITQAKTHDSSCGRPGSTPCLLVCLARFTLCWNFEFK